MFRFLAKNLREKKLKIGLRFLMSQKTENVIGGGLEKPQGSLKEEKYFSELNNNLMEKIRGHDTEPNNYRYVDNFQQQNLSTKNSCTALRNSCSLSKHKNCLEEAFFLNQQNECCTILCKENDLKSIEVKEATELDTK